MILYYFFYHFLESLCEVILVDLVDKKISLVKVLINDYMIPEDRTIHYNG